MEEKGAKVTATALLYVLYAVTPGQLGRGELRASPSGFTKTPKPPFPVPLRAFTAMQVHNPPLFTLVQDLYTAQFQCGRTCMSPCTEVSKYSPRQKYIPYLLYPACRVQRCLRTASHRTASHLAPRTRCSAFLPCASAAEVLGCRVLYSIPQIRPP